MQKRMEAQSAEFKAVNALSKSYNALPAVVDDAYPEFRHYYESDARALVVAMKNNGRIEGDFINRLMSAIETRSAKEFKSSEWTAAQWACALAGEVGELCNLIKKEWRDANIPREEIEHEIADVLIYLAALAIHYGVDLQAATVRKFNITSDKRGYKTRL